MSGAFRLGVVAASTRGKSPDPGGGGDPHFDHVSALLHFDGEDNGTVIVDETGKGWSLIGDAVTSTAQKRFGPSSLAVDGTGDGAACDSPHSDFAFGTGDFTVEAWVRLPIAMGATYQTVVQPNSSYLSGLMINTNVNKTVFWYDNGIRARGIVDLTPNAWHHIAAVRKSGVVRIFVNGVIGVETWNDTRNYSSNGAARVGTPTAALGSLDGFVDDVRITKGVARYDASFAPPDAPFPNF